MQMIRGLYLWRALRETAPLPLLALSDIPRLECFLCKTVFKEVISSPKRWPTISPNLKVHNVGSGAEFRNFHKSRHSLKHRTRFLLLKNIYGKLKFWMRWMRAWVSLTVKNANALVTWRGLIRSINFHQLYFCTAMVLNRSIYLWLGLDEFQSVLRSKRMFWRLLRNFSHFTALRIQQKCCLHLFTVSDQHSPI